LKGRISYIFDMETKKRVIFRFCTILLLISLSSVFVACSATKSNTGVNNDQTLLAEIPEEEIYLYALNKVDDEQIPAGLYKGMRLSINGKEKDFDWENIAMISDLPQLYYVDLNEDEKEELVVILSQGRGTGAVRQIVHVINVESLDEYKMENPLDVIEDQVEITILSPKEAEIKIGEKVTNVNLEDVDLLRPGVEKISADIFYENYIMYEITDNNILKATIGAEVEPLAYLGFIEIDYSFQDGKFKSNHIALDTVPKK